jgi:hypothetical protein
VVDDAIGDAADQEPLEVRHPSVSHDDQVNVVLLRAVDDRLGRMPRDDDGMQVQASEPGRLDGFALDAESR